MEILRHLTKGAKHYVKDCTFSSLIDLIGTISHEQNKPSIFDIFENGFLHLKLDKIMNIMTSWVIM